MSRELGLRCRDELVVAFPGVATPGHPVQLDIARTHPSNLARKSREASVAVMEADGPLPM
jgi:hypothetical protein